MASIDSIDYELSSSEDEKPVSVKETHISDLEITIARDNFGLSPAKTDVSDAKTSDITKVSRIRDLGGIIHENSPSVSASQRLETRSDLSDVVHVNKNTASDTPQRSLDQQQPTSL